MCSELVWVINQISANGGAHAVGIILLGPMVYDYACIGDGAVFGDAPDFFMGEKKDSVSANSGTSLPCASLWSSLDIAGTQSGLRRLCMSLVYFMMVSLVTG